MSVIERGMSDYTRVLKGLRHCINLDGLEPNDTRIRCHGCPYFTEPTRCGGILMRDAAAAIEELQAELEKKRTADCWGCKCEKLEPKRGEWIKRHEFVEDTRFDGFRCSICNWWKGDFETYNYCPKCGAKMEVQDEGAGGV